MNAQAIKLQLKFKNSHDEGETKKGVSMATVASDSLFSVLQNFLSPDVLQKISTEINQPIEKTKAGLKSVIPAMLMGIVNKGATKEGAESLVNMATKQPTPSIVSADSATMKEGDEVLNNIFGNNLSNTVSNLGVSTGMNTGSIAKMMGMSAPLIMGFIGSKIKNEKMNASGLMNFLAQQKTALMAFMPSGFSGVTGLGGVQNNKIKSSVWPKIILAVLLVTGGFWLFNSFRTKSTSSMMETSRPVRNTAIATTTVQSIGGLQNFMNSNAPNGTLMRFRFDKLLFKSGTAGLVTGANQEINQIAFTMKTYPNSTARIEGFTDSTGPNSVNEGLSYNRAMTVKRELISQGINPGRLVAVGMGEKNPIATNETALGRAQNRRIEFIVKK